MGDLTEKQRKFVEVYNGNAKESIEAAGYNTKGNHDVMCSKLLNNPKVLARLKKRWNNERLIGISDLQDRQKFWTDVMNGDIKINGKPPTFSIRLKASEILGRSQGDFVEKSNITINTDEEVVDNALKAFKKAQKEACEREARERST